jgi:SAM-dependent methyltransferase
MKRGHPERTRTNNFHLPVPVHLARVSFWRWKAPAYSLLRRLPPAKQILDAEKQNLLRLLRQFPPPAGLHLDLGSGAGDSLDILPPEQKRLAVDAEIAMLKRNPSSWRVAARAEALPFPDKSFAFVSAIGLLEYIAQTEKFFDEVKRALRPGGIFLFTSSPPIPANRLRWFWGDRLYLHSEEMVKMMLRENNGWRLLGCSRSLLQEQWLACREAFPV